MNTKAPKPLIIGLLAAFGTGLITLFMLKRKSDIAHKPPKGAPQLHLKNPGSQDQFVTAPSESEMG
ncbi:MAG: hypothetical protein WKF70_00655 [Chitinophagaceae bacterium]